DVENADIDRRDQHVYVLGDRSVGVLRVDLERERLLGSHLFRRRHGQRQLALRTIQRQVQHAHRAFRRDVGLALARTDYQRTDVEEFLVVVIAPAIAVGVVPVVVTTLADQPHFK
nr:hypothetical protein [Tanacetum cinerariifolium]